MFAFPLKIFYIMGLNHRETRTKKYRQVTERQEVKSIDKPVSVHKPVT